MKLFQFKNLPVVVIGTTRKERGFTLIEIMVVLAIIAILASVALPSYQSYIMKSRAKSATADLAALGLTLENRFQKTLNYPVYSPGTLIEVSPSARTGTLASDFGAWAPSQGKWFSYTISSTAGSYTLAATGASSMKCNLSMDNKNTRTASGTSCGFTEW